MMNIKEQSMTKLLAFADVLSEAVHQMDNLGRQATECCSFDGMTRNELNKVHKELMFHIDEYEKQRIEIAKEIQRRVKKELGLTKGPHDIQSMIGTIMKKHPLIGKGEAEIGMIKEQQKRKKENKELLN